jgi:putative oxygen-independent coproporphyrinogen III oxidase
LSPSLSPLAVYVHWPYCARICPYCDFNVVRDRGQVEQVGLARAIVEDLHTQAALTGPRRLGSIFFGGGTPSLMDPQWVADIVEAARRLWPSQAPVEITLEANPTDAEAQRFSALAAAGVDRLSLGVQALSDPALEFLGRNHDADEARRAAALAGRIFPRLSLDLIYALPGQTPEAWAEALRTAIDIGPEHISPYQLTIESGTAFHRAVQRKTWIPPDDATGAALYETTQEVLSARGFDAYEVSNHARGPAARSRHNLAYWLGEDYIGAGPGAHGRLTLEGGRIATWAAPKVADYIRKVAETGTGIATRETLSPRDQALERLLMGLRIEAGVAWDEIAPLALTSRCPAVVEFAAQGLVRVSERSLAVTASGRQLLDRLIAALAQAGEA